MKNTLLSRNILISTLAVLFSFGAIANNAVPEKTQDGLVRIKSENASVVYKNPDAVITPYKAVKILDCFVSFKKDWLKHNREIAGQLISTKDMETAKTKLSAEFKAVFAAEFEAAGYKVVDEVADDVLIIRPAILNLDPTVPGSAASGFNRVYASSAGSMTLFMELYDGPTSSIIARVYDAQADDSAFNEWQNRVNNKQAADKILKKWASLLIKNMTKV